MRARHVDRTGPECVFADRLLRRGLLTVFAAVLISVLAVFAIRQRKYSPLKATAPDLDVSRNGTLSRVRGLSTRVMEL